MPTKSGYPAVSSPTSAVWRCPAFQKSFLNEDRQDYYFLSQLSWSCHRDPLTHTSFWIEIEEIIVNNLSYKSCNGHSTLIVNSKWTLLVSISNFEMSNNEAAIKLSIRLNWYIQAVYFYIHSIAQKLWHTKYLSLYLTC